jgi:PAS domain S-box-containing protein
VGAVKRMAAEPVQEGCEQQFRLAVEASLDGFWDFNMARNTAHYSSRWQAIAGFEPCEYAGELDHWLERVHLEDRPRFETELKALCAGKSKRVRNEHRLRDRQGFWRWVLVHRLAGHCRLKNGGWHDAEPEVTRIAGSMTDHPERRMSDPLTGLPNRMYFIEHLERRLERALALEVWDFAVLSLAIERFKMVNESLGYAGGDALLMETASRLTDAMVR